MIWPVMIVEPVCDSILIDDFMVHNSTGLLTTPPQDPKNPNTNQVVCHRNHDQFYSELTALIFHLSILKVSISKLVTSMMSSFLGAKFTWQ